MVAGVKIGTITDPRVTGNLAITGVGFRPAGVIISQLNAIGGVDSARGSFGAAISSSARFAGSYKSRDSQATAVTTTSFQTNAAISVVDLETDAVDGAADYVSSDSGGFTINFSNITDGAANFHYIAFARGVNMAVGSFDINAATGNQTVTGIVNQDGASFTGQLVLFYNTAANVTEGAAAAGRNMFGSATSSTNRICTAGMDTDAADPINCSRYLTASKCIIQVSPTAVTGAADFVSFANGQFTIDVTTAPAAAFRIGYIVLSGKTGTFAAHCGTYQAKTTTGTKSETGVPFQPNTLFTCHGASNALDVVESAMSMGFGATNGTLQFAQCSNAADNVATSSTDRGGRSDKIQLVSNSAAALTTEAAWTAWTSDGFTIDWTVVDGNSYYFGYVAMLVPDAPDGTVPAKMHEYRRRRVA